MRNGYGNHGDSSFFEKERAFLLLYDILMRRVRYGGYSHAVKAVHMVIKVRFMGLIKCYLINRNRAKRTV